MADGWLNHARSVLEQDAVTGLCVGVAWEVPVPCFVLHFEVECPPEVPILGVPVSLVSDADGAPLPLPLQTISWDCLAS